MSAAKSPSDAVVGQRMRVTADDGSKQRALVLCTMDDKHQCGYQVEYDDGTEAVVPVESVQPLFDWEYEAASEEVTKSDAIARHTAAERLKSQGNELFKLKDSAAALQRYMLALRELQADCRFEPGARCLVKPPEGVSGVPRAALLLTVETDGSAADLEYEPALSGAYSGRGAVSDRLSCLLEQAAQVQAGEALAASGEDEAACEVEEDGVPRGRVAMLVHHEHAALQCVAHSISSRPQPPHALISPRRTTKCALVLVLPTTNGRAPFVHLPRARNRCALLLNMSKCSLLQKDWGSALARAGRAERVAAHDRTDPPRTAALRRTAVVVSARAALGMQRFGYDASTAHLPTLACSVTLPPPAFHSPVHWSHFPPPLTPASLHQSRNQPRVAAARAATSQG